MRSPEEVRTDPRLAVNGARPWFDEAPYEDSGIVAEAAEAVADVVRTRRTVHWGGGPQVKRLEAAFADRLGMRHCFFHSTGTAALHTALFSLGVEEGTPVGLSDSGFVASLNVVRHLGARPVFLPTDPGSMLCVDDVSEWVAGHEIHTSLITHFFGLVADVEAIHRTAGSRYLVEDGAQAIGATLRGRPVGTFGDIGSFAASNRKLVTAGQGGLNVHNDDQVDWRMRTYAHHGKAGNYEGVFPGYNFRGGEMEAVLALAALDQLDERVTARNASADVMHKIFEQAGIRTARMPSHLDATPSAFDVVVILDERWLGHRDWLVDALNADNIGAWQYPALIAMPWVKPWMQGKGWWSEREEELLRTETALWDRVFVLPTQVSVEDAERTAALVAGLLA